MGIGGDRDQERYGEGGGGPAVIGTPAPQHVRRVARMVLAGLQQVNGFADGDSMLAVAQRVAAAAGADSRRAQRLVADTFAAADACEIDPVRDLGLGAAHFPEPSVVGAGPERDGAMRLLTARGHPGLTPPAPPACAN
ncbi:hypothetical protein ACWEP8_38645 [Streptomyces hydrogenans]